jgi:hypothetical protein
MARIQLSRGRLRLKQKVFLQATTFFRNAQVLYREIGDPRGIVAATMLLAWAYLRQLALQEATCQAWSAIQVIWQARLVRPHIVAGILRRWGKW